MLGENLTPNNGHNSSSNIIKSGYDTKKLPGMGRVKTDFTDALTLHGDSELTVENINKFSRMAGEYQGRNAIARRLFRAKINAARQAQGFANTVLNHAQQASQQEVAWERMTANAMRKLGESEIDLGVERHQIDGYSRFQSEAHDIMRF